MARIFVDVAIFCFCIEFFPGRFPFSFCVSIHLKAAAFEAQGNKTRTPKFIPFGFSFEGAAQL